MSNITYTTRGDSPTYEKSKVWFCCHPEDFSMYFKEISEDIFNIVDCTIYYDEYPNSNYDLTELLFELSQMQLFVIPITKRFLEEESRARCTELAYAIEHNIPILPLMQEPGLDKQFNEICGHFHFLYKDLNDPTAITFKEKFSAFLNTVLLPNDIMDKIKKAFDAQIFLSYRKKDRKEAQRLMKMIHENEHAKYVAIWYDEFLTPGENFDDAIKGILIKSDIFAMVITPNLINESNYVLNEEYPTALKEGKTVLPIEMVMTNKSVLQLQLPGLTHVIFVGENSCFHREITKVIEKIVANQEHSSEQDYLIGLAYLNGIDVEINHELALNLIISAAEAKLPDAVLKAADMYHYGIGVKPDYKKAIVWYKKYIELLLLLNKKDRNLSNSPYWKDLLVAELRMNLKSAIRAMINLGKLYLEFGDLENAARFCEEAERIADDESIETYQFDSLQLLAEIYTEQKNYNEAKRLLDKINELLSHLYTKDHDICEQIEVMFGEARILIESKKDFDSALAIYQNIYNLTHSNITLFHYAAYASRFLASIYLEKEMTAEAESFYKTSIEIATKEYEIKRSKGALSTLLHCYFSYCQYSEETEAPSLESYYLKYINFAKRIDINLFSLQTRKAIATICSKLGHLQYKDNRFFESRIYFDEAVRIWDNISSIINDCNVLFDLHCDYHMLGMAYFKSEQFDKAKKYLDKSLDIGNQISDELGIQLMHKYLMDNIRTLLYICFESNNYVENKSYIISGINRCQQYQTTFDVLIDENRRMKLMEEYKILLGASKDLRLYSEIISCCSGILKNYVGVSSGVDDAAVLTCCNIIHDTYKKYHGDLSANEIESIIKIYEETLWYLEDVVYCILDVDLDNELTELKEQYKEIIVYIYKDLIIIFQEASNQQLAKKYITKLQNIS